MLSDIMHEKFKISVNSENVTLTVWSILAKIPMTLAEKKSATVN